MSESISAIIEKRFEIALDAPDGIQRLREMILTLGMRGKLVPQDPRDEPASELLKKIEAEKKRQAKEHIIKEPSLLSHIKPEAIPYLLPESWKWVNFGEIAQHNSGKTLDSGRNSGTLRDYITTSNLYWGRFELNNVRQMPIHSDELKKCTAQKNDLLICEGGEAGRAAVWLYDYDICFQNHIHRARFYTGINPFFAFYLFRKIGYTGEIERFRKGVGISNMSSKALSSIPFPLPPLAEQKRIVAKIDELTKRCDELEKLKEARSRKKDEARRAATAGLLKAPDARSAAEAFSFIHARFDTLYDSKENVAELRKAILQLAVMGRLVSQDPSDEPASELLKKIEAEKKRLVREGKIKEPKPLPEIKPEEVPFQVPKGWEWVRLGEITSKIHYGFTASANENRSDVKLLRITDIQDNKVDWQSVPGCIIKNENIDQYQLSTNDILIARTGGTVGKTYLVKDIDVKAVFASYLIRVVPPTNTEVKYLKFYLESPLYWQQLLSACSGTGQPNVNGVSLSMLKLPLPPLAEQKRIVAKVDRLMALCEEMERGIEAARAKRGALLEAVASRVSG